MEEAQSSHRNILALTPKKAMEKTLEERLARLEHLEAERERHVRLEAARVRNDRQAVLKRLAPLPPAATYDWTNWCLVHIQFPDGRGHQTGFIITKDGFVLTTLAASQAQNWEPSLDGRFCASFPLGPGCNRYAERVQDFDAHGVSLLRVSKNFECLKPDDEVTVGDAVEWMGKGTVTFNDSTMYVGLRGHVADATGVIAVDNADYCTERNGWELLGGPVVGLKSRKLVGVVTKADGDSWTQQHKANFCPLTKTSSTWLEISQAMEKYLEKYSDEIPFYHPSTFENAPPSAVGAINS